MRLSEISFILHKGSPTEKRVKFVVRHNCPDIPGLSINDAVNSWSIRTNEYTAESLSAYIESKDFKCKPIKTEEVNNDT